MSNPITAGPAASILSSSRARAGRDHGQRPCLAMASLSIATMTTSLEAGSGPRARSLRSTARASSADSGAKPTMRTAASARPSSTAMRMGVSRKRDTNGECTEAVAVASIRDPPRPCGWPAQRA
jgi:hypothetical protein